MVSVGKHLSRKLAPVDLLDLVMLPLAQMLLGAAERLTFRDQLVFCKGCKRVYLNATTQSLLK